MNIDKTAMLNGWLMGRKVKGLMKPQEAPAHWETLKDSETTTVFKSDYPKAAAQSSIGTMALLDDVGATYKITIDGVVHIGQPTKLSNAMIYIGNPYLVDNETHEDTGEDFCVRTWATTGGIGLDWLYTRTPGTYKLKIEKQITT